MMLESTLHAVHSSFHAVLGVAEHLTKMKLQVSQVSNTFNCYHCHIIRTSRNFTRPRALS